MLFGMENAIIIHEMTRPKSICKALIVLTCTLGLLAGLTGDSGREGSDSDEDDTFAKLEAQSPPITDLGPLA